MKIAFISDIHSNEEALDAVLKDISRQNIDELWCLGDIVGYGASPKECLDKVRENCDVIVAGNHDHAVANLVNIHFFNVNAKRAVEWTRNQLFEQDIEFLKKLPLTYSNDRVVGVHANLYNPLDWKYVLDEFDADSTLGKMGHLIACFIGHSHVPIVFEEDNIVRFLGTYDSISFIPNRRYIINVGSVGQPRDANPKAAYAIFDSDTNVVNLIRLDYNIQSAQKKIVEAGLPEFLAARIAFGR